MSQTFTPEKHGLATRIAHIGLALAVVTQLGTSLVMQPAEHGHASNVAFEIHEYAGLIALGFAFLFWVAMVTRSAGTSLGLLFPWFSTRRRTALWADTREHIKAARRLRLPDFSAQSPFAAAVHGLGLVLMSAMALSGASFYFLGSGDPDAGGLVGAAMTLHRGLANLVWAYLIGHAALAFLHHVTHHLDLREMWSLRSGHGSAGVH